MLIEKLSEGAFSISTVDRVRHNSRISDKYDDQWIVDALASATDYCERALECCIARSNWRLTLDSFPARDEPIHIPLWPIHQVAAISYTNTAGTTTTLDLANIVQPVGMSRYDLRPRFGINWPEAQPPNGVRIEFSAGWAELAAVPATIQRAALMLISHWYENREATLIGVNSKEIELGFDSMIEMVRPGVDSFAWGS
jgi:uncharacterized phiE125 gp8 family phage protein